MCATIRTGDVIVRLSQAAGSPPDKFTNCKEVPVALKGSRTDREGLSLA